MTSRSAPEQTPVQVLTEHLAEPADGRVAPDRPGPGDRRRPPAPAPPVLVVRAIAGAALSVCAVATGVVVLLWVDRVPESVTAVSRPAVSPATTPSPSPSPAPVPAPVRPAAVPSVVPPPPLLVPVTVLNNSRRTQLAARGAARFAAGGWPVAAVGNFRGRIPVTTVYYDPGLEASAREFAARFEGIVRVRPRFATLPARGVVVVLTREFAV